MKEAEHLLTCLSEEALETALAASKALRFGLFDFAPEGDGDSNRIHILKEYFELTAVLEMLQTDGILPKTDLSFEADIKSRKKQRVRTFIDHARSTGALEGR